MSSERWRRFSNGSGRQKIAHGEGSGVGAGSRKGIGPMRTGPNLTDLNNRMILWEFERAIEDKRYRLADKIFLANPQIGLMTFVFTQSLVQLRKKGLT